MRADGICSALNIVIINVKCARMHEFLDCRKTGMRIMKEWEGTEVSAVTEGNEGEGGA